MALFQFGVAVVVAIVVAVSSARGGVTFPGTLWCGPGNNAANDTDRGEARGTDDCCHAHDRCNNSLAQGESMASGFINTDFFTYVFHCDCDYAFRDCLKAVNTSTAHIVGDWYFNQMRRRCFKRGFQQRCVKKEEIYPGWMKCVEYEEAAAGFLIDRFYFVIY